MVTIPNLNQFTGSLTGIGNSIFVLIFTIGVMLTIILTVLFYLRWRRFVYNIIIYRDFGAGQCSLTSCKAGRFKANKSFFGLLDTSGPLQLVTDEKINMRWAPRIIQESSDHDMKDIGWKKGFVVMQSPEDPQILIPITKVKCTNSELLFDIASADFRDTALRCQEEAERSMAGRYDKLLQYAAPIILFIIALIMLFGTLQGVQKILADAYIQVNHMLSSATSAATTIPSQAP